MELHVVYSKHYNINLGFLNNLHPFDGLKFKKVFESINSTGTAIQVVEPLQPITDMAINSFVDDVHSRLLKKKSYILRALEAPKVPVVSLTWIDKKILTPMRWGVAGTLTAAKRALAGDNHWNLAGGYHHASKARSEGFCIYNDIGITVNELRHNGQLSDSDKVLLIDIDAHHGNGNAYTFLEDSNVTILDIYNRDIYPTNAFTRERVNISIPLAAGTIGDDYLPLLKMGLDDLQQDYKIAFVVAGTDVIAQDPLGGLGLSVAQCVERDVMVAKKLQTLSIPFVFLGGGGYSKSSVQAIAASIQAVSQIN